MDEGEHLLQQRVQELRMAPGESGHLHLVERCQESAAEGLVRPLCCWAGQQSLDQLPLQTGQGCRSIQASTSDGCIVVPLCTRFTLAHLLPSSKDIHSSCVCVCTQEGLCCVCNELSGVKGEQQHLPGHPTGHLLSTLDWPGSLFQAAPTVSVSGHRPGSAFSRRAD